MTSERNRKETTEPDFLSTDGANIPRLDLGDEADNSSCGVGTAKSIWVRKISSRRVGSRQRGMRMRR